MHAIIFTLSYAFIMTKEDLRKNGVHQFRMSYAVVWFLDDYLRRDTNQLKNHQFLNLLLLSWTFLQDASCIVIRFQNSIVTSHIVLKPIYYEYKLLNCFRSCFIGTKVTVHPLFKFKDKWSKWRQRFSLRKSEFLWFVPKYSRTSSTDCIYESKF